VQARLVRSRVVRTLNHIGYHELEADSRPHGDPERRAVAVAGNDAAAVALVADFIDSIGFDPVVTGELATASAFAPDTPIFDGWYNAGDMRDAVTNFTHRAPQEAPSWS
jgi:8-hydroxy-5-deazaflavin:NADPH oxidoreductase